MGLMQRDIDSTIAFHSGAAALSTWCSSSTSNGDQQTGRQIDRLALSRRYLAAKVGVTVQGQRTTATSYGNGVSVLVGLQDAAATSAFADYSTGDWNTTLLGSITSGSTSTSTEAAFVASAGFDLSRARRYIRPVYTITQAGSSSGGLGVIQAMAHVALGGAELLPTT